MVGSAAIKMLTETWTAGGGVAEASAAVKTSADLAAVCPVAAARVEAGLRTCFLITISILTDECLDSVN